MTSPEKENQGATWPHISDSSWMQQQWWLDEVSWSIEAFHPTGSHMGQIFMALHLLYCAIKWTMNVKQAEWL